MKTIAFRIFALALLAPLAACSPSGQTDADAGSQAANGAGQDRFPPGLSGEIQKAMHEAAQDMARENIDVDSVHAGRDKWHFGRTGQAKAQITPQGTLLIDGKPVDATPAQQAMLLDYRQQMLGIAAAGMDLGAQGASLGVDAARQAVQSAFAGKSGKDIEAAIKPQTDKLQAAATALCGRLPALMATQQKLAAAMPAFRPYATMRQADIDDCSKDMANKAGKGVAVFSD